MKQLTLTHEQIEYALARLTSLIELRGLNQTQLEQLSSVPQPTISKILNRQEAVGIDTRKPSLPSVDVLTKLFRALGLRLTDVLNEPDAVPQEIVGYLATPLTGVVRDPKSDSELSAVVARIKDAVAAPEFSHPMFDVYWPGDHTHPTRNANFTPSQVYRIDRSRASTFDFVILLCCAPSYGVGQENEIATQAGIPAIRFIPHEISRMITGSFIKAVDVHYSGALSSRIDFDKAELTEALRSIRLIYFKHRALYKGLNGDGFGPRLRKLVDERSGDYKQFASELGIDISYFHALMDEPFAVSNPSARLLKRMAVLLHESVAYLIGESEETDAVYVESNLSFKNWIANADGIDARLAFSIREEWRKGYFEERRLAVKRDYRRTPMTISDWYKRYREVAGRTSNNERQQNIFG
jgi:transcriptional regulator with XRE-family HTH domain